MSDRAGAEATVVVSTYDERRWGELTACLDSLAAQTCPSLETIVVADHNPRLLERVREAFPAVTAVPNRRSRGLAGARNTGIRLARGSLVAFIDDDARADPRWLELMQAGLSAAGEAGVGVGGALLPAWTGPAPRWLPREFFWTIGCSYTGLPSAPAPIRNPIGANMAVRADVLQEVGGFREDGEAPRELRSRGVVRAAGNIPDDTDLAIRVSTRRPGAVWLYQPAAIVHHTVTAERASFPYFIRRCYEEGAGKAGLVRQVGGGQGLSSERRHLTAVLPAGFVRGLRELIRGRPAGGLQAAAILAGTLAVVTGFALGAAGGRGMRRARAGTSPRPGPVAVEEVELSAPLPPLPSRAPSGSAPFGSIVCLARLHGRPLGLVEAELPAAGLDPSALATLLQAELGGAVAGHLRADGLAAAPVAAGGIASPPAPACAAAREGVLLRAPEASVVIVTRGRPQQVLRTIGSIAAGSYPRSRYELIVVDTPEKGAAPLDLGADAPGDGLRLRILVEPEPGISRARNAGLAVAEGEFVVFADDDVDVERDWLASLIAGFGLGDRVDAVSGPTLPASLETSAERWFQNFGGLVRSFETRVYGREDRPPDQPLFPFLPGALGSGRGMAFRAERLRELGGFDPALGPPTPTLAGEDIEALLRVLLAGGQVVHEPAALVRHSHPRDYGTLQRRAWGYGLGLSACLTKSVLDHPGLLPELIRKLPRGAAFALSPRSEKNAGRGRGYPPGLVWRERAGLACGPLAYTRSRWQQRRERAAGGGAAWIR